jgi:hypothetical protein
MGKAFGLCLFTLIALTFIGLESKAQAQKSGPTGAATEDEFLPDEYVEKTIEKYRTACEHGDGEECNKLGNFVNQLGKKQDASKYYKLSCDRHYYDGCTNLGLMESGTGDEAAAKRHYQLACSANSPSGCAYLGLYDYRDGNLLKAKSLAQKSCSGNYSTGCFLLGLVQLKDGDTQAAYGNFKRGCDGGTAKSCHFLAMHEAQQGNIFEARRLFKKACDGGESEACKNDENATLDYGITTAPRPKGTVAKEFQPYLTRLKSEAKARKVSLGNRAEAVTIRFAFNLTDYNTLGECKPNTLEIGIAESYWVTASDVEKEELLFHELGHCLLGREHDNGLMPISGGSIYKSIMNSQGNILISRFPIASRCREFTNDYFLLLGDCGTQLIFDPKGKTNFYKTYHKVYLDELFGIARESEPPNEKPRHTAAAKSKSESKVMLTNVAGQKPFCRIFSDDSGACDYQTMKDCKHAIVDGEDEVCRPRSAISP